jgi:hypothetical protein
MNYWPIPSVHNRDVFLVLYTCYKQQHASDKTPIRVNGNGSTPYLNASALQEVLINGMCEVG